MYIIFFHYCTCLALFFIILLSCHACCVWFGTFIHQVCCVISPHSGPRSEILVSVPITAANGHTSFSPESLQVMVEVPLLPSPVQLRVSRSWACGEANVTWGVTLLDATLEDIRITAGVVTIPHGESVLVL